VSFLLLFIHSSTSNGFDLETNKRHLHSCTTVENATVNHHHTGPFAASLAAYSARNSDGPQRLMTALGESQATSNLGNQVLALPHIMLDSSISTSTRLLSLLARLVVASTDCNSRFISHMSFRFLEQL
jgi:hypothetical protein